MFSILYVSYNTHLVYANHFPDELFSSHNLIHGCYWCDSSHICHYHYYYYSPRSVCLRLSSFFVRHPRKDLCLLWLRHLHKLWHKWQAIRVLERKCCKVREKNLINGPRMKKRDDDGKKKVIVNPYCDSLFVILLFYMLWIIRENFLCFWETL